MNVGAYVDYLNRQGPGFHAARLYVMRDQIPRLLWQTLTAAVRVVPDIQLLGAQKAGTTSVHAMLLRHPDVVSGLAKESHFFDGRSIFGPPRRPRLAALTYRAFFPTAWHQWGHRWTTGRRLRVLDATPITLMLPEAPRLLHRINPAARLIAVLRDPVERAWSHYRMNVRWGRESLPFAEALAAEEALWSSGGSATEAHWHRSYVRRGRYAEQLHRFVQAGFGPDQLLLLSFDDLRDDPRGVADRVYAFVGLEPFAAEVAVDNRGDDSVIPPEVAARLRELFRAPNEALVRDFSFAAASRWLAR